MKVDLNSGKYVVAVSGGVDSMMLLDLLSNRDDLDLVVTHYDHGIREDSAQDTKLVQDVAKKLGLKFETEKGELGPDASEAQAREARYDFLRRMAKKHKTDAIATAHHQDDAVETLIINLLRGTGRRGVLKETKEIKRPLLKTSKEEILEYAKSNNLQWREDSTNADTKYLRNYVRLELLPKLTRSDPEAAKKLLNSSVSLEELNKDIDEEVAAVLQDKCDITKKKAIVPRQWLIMLPNEVGCEVLYECVRKLDIQADIDRKNIKNLLVFSKTAKNNKRTSLSKNIIARTEPSKIIIELV